MSNPPRFPHTPTSHATLSRIFPVVPTTFHEAGTLDLASQKRCLDSMIDSGVDGLCILANFSEQFLVSDEEREVLTRLSLEHVAGRVPVIVTTTHTSAKVCAERSRRAQDMGAAMVMPPYQGATFRFGEAAIDPNFLLSRVLEARNPELLDVLEEILGNKMVTNWRASCSRLSARRPAAWNSITCRTRTSSPSFALPCTRLPSVKRLCMALPWKRSSATTSPARCERPAEADCLPFPPSHLRVAFLLASWEHQCQVIPTKRNADGSSSGSSSGGQRKTA